MKTETKIIRFFIETGKEPTIKELAEGIKADYKIVHTAAMRLAGKGILKKKRIGNSIQLKFAYAFSKEVFEAEFERREEILRNKNLRAVFEAIKSKIGSVNFVLILFGSYAKNKARKTSDIDFMFIVSETAIERRIEQATSILPFKIHYFVFTEEQFKEMSYSKEPNVVHEAIKNNIILHGIEQYYELIERRGTLK